MSLSYQYTDLIVKPGTMRRVTLLLSGVPKHVSIVDLSYNLDLLFNTDDIGTFKLRDLPNHPQTDRRQIALDFMTSFDAMTAQEKLDGYQYEMKDGRQYTLRAKLNKVEEYMHNESLNLQQSGNSSWYGADWRTLSLVPTLDGEIYQRPNAKLDAQLDLLRKQQQLIAKEKELLRETRRLKRVYGSMHAHDESETSSKHSRSRSRSREHRSSSWHRRSWSRERVHHNSRRKSSEHESTNQRSRSRDRTTHFNYRTMARAHWDRRSRSPERRPKQLAIMPRSPERLKTPVRTIVSYDDNTPTGKNKLVKNGKEATVTHEKEDKSKKEKKSKDEKGVAKFNSKIKKAEMLESKVKEFTKDVMVLIIILLEELMNKDNIRISTSSKDLFIKKLEEVVGERVEPLARAKKITDFEVLRKYKELYPREVDFVMIKEMLDKIPKIQEEVSQSTVTVSSAHLMSHLPEPEILKLGDIEEQKNTDETLPVVKQEPIIIDLESVPSSPQIKKEKIEEETPMVIDIDSAEKPIPRHPQFVVVIKALVKKMNRVGVQQLLLNNNIEMKHFHNVLRHILRKLLKGQGYIPRPEIISKFREVYPLDKDEEFVNKVIKDIKDGKYPRCMDHIEVITEDDCPDDPDAVLVIENSYDVVTVADSDDDDEKKPITEVINLDCDSPQNMPTRISNPENLGSIKSTQANATEKTDTPTQHMPVSENSVHLIVSDNLNRDKSCQSVPANNPSQVKAVASQNQATIHATNVSQTAPSPVDLNPTKQQIEKKQKNTGTAEFTESAKMHSVESYIGKETPDASESPDNEYTNKNQAVDNTSGREKVEEKSSQVLNSTKKYQIYNNNETDKNQEYDHNQLKNDQVKDNQPKESVKENDNNYFKVTAITIVTSFDDLLAKSSARPKEEEASNKNIKEELEYEEDRQDVSTLQPVPDSGPVVTSTTIMTADAELFSISHEDGRKEVNEIKNEEEICYDAVESLFNDIERDINNDMFSLHINRECNILSGTTDKQILPQESRTEDDDDESIESISRYIASLY